MEQMVVMKRLESWQRIAQKQYDPWARLVVVVALSTISKLLRWKIRFQKRF